MAKILPTKLNFKMPPPIIGTEGDDTIIVENFDNTISNILIDGLGGNDVIKLLGGFVTNVTINGGAGNDEIEIQAGGVKVNGGDGNDIITGGTGASTIHGNAGNDDIRMGAGGTSIFGDEGNDQISIFSGGKVSISGGTGNDTIRHTRLDDNTAIDTISGGAGNDTINSEGNRSIINGDAGNDYIGVFGNANIINGGTGNDTILINGNDNVITLGLGKDTITFTQSNSGKITDFNHFQDKLQFSSNLFATKDDVMSHFHAASAGVNAYIDMGGGHHLEFSSPNFTLNYSDINII